MNDRLSRIVDRLTRTIPDPPAPIARPAGSFAGLRPGQLVKRRLDVEWMGTGSMPTGMYQVTRTDSLGAYLSCPGEITFRLDDRDWKATWQRVRPPHKRKAIP